MLQTKPHALLRVQNPSSEPISLAEAKFYLRIDGSSEDITIAGMIQAAREQAEEYLRKSLVQQIWKITYKSYAPLQVPLPRGPVHNIIQVKKRDKQGQETVIPSDSYRLNMRTDRLCFESTIMSPYVEILYETGYGENEDVPASIRQGMLMHLTAMYERRVEGNGLPPMSVSLYRHHRNIRI